MPFGTHLDSIWARVWDRFEVKIPYKFAPQFGCGSEVDFGSPGQPPNSKSIVLLLENKGFQRSAFSRPGDPVLDFGLQKGARREPKCLPKSTKKVLRKSTQTNIKKDPRTEPKWTPKGTQKETKNRDENGAEKETQKRGENKPGYHGTGSAMRKRT